MIQTTLEILSAAIGCMCTESQIMAKIDFVMTDSTSHNLGVIELVSEEVEAGFPIQGSRVQNQWVAPRSTQPFILPRLII